MNTVRLEKLKEMEAQKPDDPFFKYAIALEYVSAGNDAEAKACFEALSERFPVYVATYLQLGNLYERLGETANAMTAYKKGIEAATAAHDAKATGELNEALLLAEDE